MPGAGIFLASRLSAGQRFGLSCRGLVGLGDFLALACSGALQGDDSGHRRLLSFFLQPQRTDRCSRPRLPGLLPLPDLAETLETGQLDEPQRPLRHHGVLSLNRSDAFCAVRSATLV